MEDRLPLTPDALNAASRTQPPSWSSAHFKGVVIDKGELFLRAIDSHTRNGHTVTTITSLPLGKENVGQIARGLGTITMVPQRRHRRRARWPANEK